MMKQSGLLKWAQNNRHHPKGSGRQWIHPPDTLQRGHIAYLVKFLGSTEVEQPKGIDVVKEGIRKLKFSSQLKRSEGTKIPKVELTISVDGVAIQEPKTKRIHHQYPLHRISYCADDKAEKKFFSFIAKEADSDKHMCFVFVSDKLAEEITLTIGQAFDLAYRRFLETSGRDLDLRRQLILLQKRCHSLELENKCLKQRIAELQEMKDQRDVPSYKEDLSNISHMNMHQVVDLCMLKEPNHMDSVFVENSINQSPPLPPRTNDQNHDSIYKMQENKNESQEIPFVGRRLENLLIDYLDGFDSKANGNSNGSSVSSNGIGSIPPLVHYPSPCNSNGHSSTPSKSSSDQSKDIFGSDPFFTCASPASSEDPFGMGDFGQVPSHLGAHELEAAIGVLDKKISEMRDGFSRGISFSKEDFSLENLDPFFNKN